MNLVPVSNCRDMSNELEAKEAHLRQKAEDKKREAERLCGEVCTLIHKIYDGRLLILIYFRIYFVKQSLKKTFYFRLDRTVFLE